MPGPIIIAAAIKIFGLFPKDLEDASPERGDMAGFFLVPAPPAGVSITCINAREVPQSLSNPKFIILTICTVVVATPTPGILGRLVKLNFVEASITPGRVSWPTPTSRPPPRPRAGTCCRSLPAFGVTGDTQERRAQRSDHGRISLSKRPDVTAECRPTVLTLAGAAGAR